MATWKDLLFGNLVGFSAFAAILLTLLIGVFFRDLVYEDVEAAG